ncbi:Pyrrolidone-carboxylate peptidase [Rubripirellula tenax]|uniref:Pyrrolidone-carboxylate peptidase n=1 Tax=Rubripirellula tenax TaxID=2528015 RepID=A0A5C6E732_9BACT|nr:pyroglutamyl-peptidase I [Rubripirellula tenax]TWU44620.1 Pyrrolidone-carboxylate peptidase [Rubripirellula tenax]
MPDQDEAKDTSVTRVLITAFEPYDRWPENSSWAALVDLTRWYDGPIEIVSRRYAVDLTRMSQNLRKDLQEDFDFAIHLGQAPGHPLIKLEAVGLNVRSDGSPLIKDAPEAYRSPLPLDRCCRALLAADIPCEVSHHAGTYLCNAALYLSQHYAQSFGMKTRSAFVHVPLTPAQCAKDPQSRMPSMSTPMASAAIAMILDQLV